MSQVTIFSDVNYSGASQVLMPGRYDLSALTIGGDQLSSLRVPKGWKVTLYADPGFQGTSKVFSADASFVGYDFNDQASSILVEAVAMIYGDINYGAAFQALDIGRYALNSLTIGGKQLTSLEVPSGWRVTLYADPGFTGASKPFTADTAYVGDDFNDQTSSIVVESVVMIYGDEKFGGKSQALGVGLYDASALTIGNDQLSSLRVSQGLMATLYADPGFQGTSKVLAADSSFVGWDFNDQTSSIVVEPAITIFKDQNYAGGSQTLGIGRYDLGALTIGGDQLSSLQVPQGLMVTLYADPGFRGTTKVFTADTSFVGADMNDLTSSLVVEPVVTIFKDQNYTGGSQVLGLGRHDVSELTIGNDQLSSLKVPFGWRVTLYADGGFQGASKVFAWDASYVGDDFNDKTSSIVIESAMNWMRSIPGIEDKKLKELCIPATHESGTYALTNTLAPPSQLNEYKFVSYLYPDLHLNDLLDQVSTKLPAFVRGWLNDQYRVNVPMVNEVVTDVMKRWGQAASLNIYDQLVLGTRSIDLRVCLKDGELRTFHAFTGPLLSDILTQIRKFLERTQGEVVIVTVSHMSMVHADHKRFIDLIVSTLGSYLYQRTDKSPAPADIAIGDITGRGNSARSRVIFVYADLYFDSTTSDSNPNLWGTALYPDGYGGRADCAYSTGTWDVVPSLIECIINALHIPGLSAGTGDQSLRGAALRLNKTESMMGTIQTAIATGTKLNSISCDFIQMSNAVPMALALSNGTYDKLTSQNFVPVPATSFRDHSFLLKLTSSSSFGFSMFDYSVNISVACELDFFVDSSGIKQTVTFSYSALGASHSDTLTVDFQFQTLADVWNLFVGYLDQVKKFFTDTLPHAAAEALRWVRDQVTNDMHQVAAFFRSAGADIRNLTTKMASTFGLSPDSVVRFVANSMDEAGALLKDCFNWGVRDVGNFFSTAYGATDHAIHDALQGLNYAAADIDQYMKDVWGWIKRIY